MIDIRTPKAEVEVLFSDSGQVMWVNVDGECVLRVQDIRPEVEINLNGPIFRGRRVPHGPQAPK